MEDITKENTVPYILEILAENNNICVYDGLTY